MQMIPVSSSDLAAVGYAGTTLWISFHSGGLYEYSGVPQSVYESLMNAPSRVSIFMRTLSARTRITELANQ